MTFATRWPTTGGGYRPAHWWSPAPDAEAPAISARRAYTETLLVFAVFFGSGIIEAVLLLVGNLPQSPLGSWGLAGAASWDQVAQGALAVGVVLLLAWRRGLRADHLGLRLRRDRAGRIRWFAELRVFAWGLLFMFGGLSVTALLYHGRGAAPFTAGPDLLLDFFHAAQAGFIEEAVVLAFVLATLTQARRPRPELVLVALVLRDSYHLYYGWGTVGITIWAVGMIWIFLRTRSIIPLIAAHSAWDVTAVLGAHWTGVAVAWFLVAMALLVTAAISWLVERSAGTASQQPAPAGWDLVTPAAAFSPTLPPAEGVAYVPPYRASVPQPGWYADPAGGLGLRWWDGAAWTAQVRSP